MRPHDSITELIGDTPLLRLDPTVHGLPRVQLFAKLESHNPFGSVKDRAAWGMIRDELPTIRAEGRAFLEASSGNTAKALRVLGAMHGIELRAVTNRIKVTEVRDMLRLLGTDIVELPGLSECPDPTAPDDVSSVIAATTAREPDRWYHASQYTNQRNVEAHHHGTGREIRESLTEAGIDRVDYVIGGLGTTGSTRGTASYLAKQNPDLRTIGVVSARDDFIPGIRSETEMWDVGLFQPDFYHRIIAVDADTAVRATLALTHRYGVLAGPTSGAAYAAALDILRSAAASLGPDDPDLVAVLIVCDRLEPYLSYLRARRPELFDDERRPAPPQPSELAAVPRLTPQSLEEADRTQRLTIVDTRGAMAYRVAHIPGAVNMRDDFLEELADRQIPFCRSRPLVFVCPIGRVSQHFAALARRAGYDAYSLTGGIAAWREAGLPLERGR
ncbi:pyridoxal-phosphate dependent enzyme [Nocardia vinacea]|uniref:Pyridoxal-phosphate dependent enzyme n=1 Tax=Nocardia vinacea TaxID=96468 RepID=A0ABZ1YNP8_9NOCA|nr:pyridoxal-phosphate dependent enzyme [Nocardia vinacea]